MIAYSIVRISNKNYALFDEMVFFRMNGRERMPDEQPDFRDFDAIYTALGEKNLRVYAAQVDNRFVGWISAAYIPKVGRYGGRGHLFIDELWIAPDFRRHGIAYALMAQIERAAREMGALGLRLYTNNPDALALYGKCGYMKIGEGACFMEKELDG